MITGEKAMATHSSTLAWQIPWMEEPGRLMSSESQTNRGRMESSFPFHRQKTEAWSTKQTKKQQQKPCQPFTTSWMDLEAIMLREINQRKINTVWDYLKNKKPSS